MKSHTTLIVWKKLRWDRHGPSARLSYRTPQSPALLVLVRATSTSEPRLSCVSIGRDNQSGAE
jgi:hypothetical protein